MDLHASTNVRWLAIIKLILSLYFKRAYKSIIKYLTVKCVFIRQHSFRDGRKTYR